MQTRRIRIRLKPGTADRMEQWLVSSFGDRHDEALASMRNNGLLWECAYIERGEVDVVVLLQCSDDFGETSRRFLGSDLPIDRDAQAVLGEVGEQFDSVVAPAYLTVRER
ncbi:DUF6176 family protein [Dactylosporangium sp. AC04546]|uniref:DUF6176 family protein n=1 Tax=Dactylosporangium sp. AC04546 TaxID=2862460 RepID=UPI001EE0E663|nr:DUF6176 family protein [Dactylosporangium sp. AC04546]WVK79050.1 DUF6176 family protein [Dactylosporangium sp. AC04546]